MSSIIMELKSWSVMSNAFLKNSSRFLLILSWSAPSIGHTLIVLAALAYASSLSLWLSGRVRSEDLPLSMARSRVSIRSIAVLFSSLDFSI